MTKDLVIDLKFLTKGEVRVLIGRERGIAARRHFELDELDHQQDTVTVLIPDNLNSISPSFFQGMFAKSVRFFKDQESFLRHYKFDATVSAWRDILIGIRDIQLRRELPSEI